MRQRNRSSRARDAASYYSRWSPKVIPPQGQATREVKDERNEATRISPGGARERVVGHRGDTGGGAAGYQPRVVASSRSLEIASIASDLALTAASPADGTAICTLAGIGLMRQGPHGCRPPPTVYAGRVSVPPAAVQSNDQARQRGRIAKKISARLSASAAAPCQARRSTCFCYGRILDMDMSSASVSIALT